MTEITETREEKLNVGLYTLIFRRAGISTNALWSVIRKYNEGYALVEFDEALALLRNKGFIACTSKRWWIRNNTSLKKVRECQNQESQLETVTSGGEQQTRNPCAKSKRG